MPAGVLAYPSRGLRHRCRCHVLRLAPPALVGMLIDVAMGAGKIAPAAYLQDVLAYASRHPAALNSRIERSRRDLGWPVRSVDEPGQHGRRPGRAFPSEVR